MKNYTLTVSLDLAQQLKAAGMPGVLMGHTRLFVPSYAEVLDWLMERDLFVIIEPSRLTSSWYHATISRRKLFMGCSEDSSWCGAAEKAIEKALTLI